MRSRDAMQRPDRGPHDVSLYRYGSSPREFGRTALLLGWLFLAIGCSSRQQDDASETAAVGAFAAKFYDSYPAHARAMSDTPAWDSIATESDAVLTSELAGALAADWRAAEMSSGEVVGLDFDPFLASQDPCDAYRIGDVVLAEGRYRVEVFGDCTEQGRRAPDVIAEVVRQNNRYLFANFHYPADSTDIQTTLRRRSEQRR